MGKLVAIDEEENVIVEFTSFEKTDDGLLLQDPNSKAGFLPHDSFYRVLKKSAVE